MVMHAIWFIHIVKVNATRQNKTLRIPFLPDGISEREPPDPIPNSEVKTFCADGSVASAM